MSGRRWSQSLVRGAAVVAAVVAACLVLALPAAARQQGEPPDAPAEQQEPRETKTIRLYAENWKWTPDVIRVKQGTLLRLEFRSEDAPHSFVLKGYKIKVPLPQDSEREYEFVVDKAGTFRWRCGRPCGDGCPKMTGKLIVE